MTNAVDPARLIADPGGRATPAEVVEAHLRAVTVAELTATGRHREAAALMPRAAADLRLLLEAMATLAADFAAIAANPDDDAALADLFNRLRLRVLTAARLA